MHIDIAASIREVLDNMESVSINALGTLQLKHIPAYFSDKGTTMSPPRMVLDIEDNITSNTPLIRTIADNYGITKDAAQKLVSTFNKKLLNNLVNYKKVSINGVALITRSDKGEVKLETTTGFLEAYYNGLPKVSIIPNNKSESSPQEEREASIIPAVINPEDSASIDTVLPKHESNGIDQITSPVEPVITEKKPPITQKQESPTPKTSPKISPKTSPTVAEFVQAISEKRDATVTPVVPVAPSVAPEQAYVYEEKKPSILWPLILLTAILLAILLCYRACSNYAFTNDNKSSDPQMTITEVDVLDGVTASDSISAQALTELRKDNSIIPASGKCKIITGVFLRNVNVVNMRDKVRGAGYEVYSESYGEYTRVGLEFNCDEETDLEAYLQEVRSVIASRAWYLDPTLYVEYVN